ncbi:MAG TPA: hypothetical protein VLM78_04120, partial [Anaerolineales bacterium]|nr:hypothetical protein [Anaerolineales bacterium]
MPSTIFISKPVFQQDGLIIIPTVENCASCLLKRRNSQPGAVSTNNSSKTRLIETGLLKTDNVPFGDYFFLRGARW